MAARQKRATETEAEFQTQVIFLARMLRWRVAHFRPARTSSGGWHTPVQADGKGFPDLVLVRERTVYAELKAAKGRLTAEQRDWLDALRAAGEEVYVWKPSDWSEVERVLGL